MKIDSSYLYPSLLLSDTGEGEGEGECPCVYVGEGEEAECHDPSLILDAWEAFYTAAHNADPAARLTYDEYGIEFRYGTYSGANNYRISTQTEQAKYKALRKLITTFQADGVPLNDIAVQMHLAAWHCLAYDTTNGDENGLRLSRAQLISLQDSVEGIGELGLGVIFSQMDVRIGVPDNPPNSSEVPSIRRHLSDTGAEYQEGRWTNLSLADRRKWQGKVYEGVLNACLAEPALRGIIFWGICDETGWLNQRIGDVWDDKWPWVPPYPTPNAQGDDEAAEECLFGCEIGEYGETRKMFHPKPAYYGVRNAITNYFGTAHTIKSFAGEDLVRFVENGNVLLMKENAAIHTGTGTGEGESVEWPNLNDVRFAFTHATSEGENENCELVAAVTDNGDLYLAGEVQQRRTEQQMAVAQPVFEIRTPDNTLVSMIDINGNLLMRDTGVARTGGESNPETGYLLVHGIPYDLGPSQCANCANDFYTCY